MEVLERPASQTVHAGDTPDEQLTCRIQRDVADVCGQLNVAHYHLVELLAEAIRSRSWFGYGIRSPEHWFSWQAGVSPTRARTFVQIAKRFDDLPVAFAAFRNGLLTIDQMALLTAYSQPYWDEQLTSLAQSATLPQLRHALSKYRLHDGQALAELVDTTREAGGRAIDTDNGVDETNGGDGTAEPARPEGSSPARPNTLQSGWVTHHYDDDGRYIIHANLPADAGSLVDQALTEAHDRLYRDGHHGVTWVDALADVATRSLGAVTTPNRRDLYRVYLHLDAEDFGSGAPAWINNGPNLPGSLVEELTCDAILKPLWHQNGTPVNVGANHPTIPAHTRRLILDRDRSCRYPGCTNTRNLEVHHIQFRIRDNGPGETSNLAGHCRPHHKSAHRGEYTVSGNADDPHGLTYRKPNGQVIAPAAQPTPPGTNAPPGPPPGLYYQHPLHEPFHYDLFQLPEPAATSSATPETGDGVGLVSSYGSGNGVHRA